MDEKRAISIAHLMRAHSGPVFRVKVAPLGKSVKRLSDLRPEALKKRIRRGLDEVMVGDLTAVGVVKVFRTPDQLWRLEAHLLIAGADRADLASALVTHHRPHKADAVVRILRVRKIDRATRLLLRSRKSAWQDVALGRRQRVRVRRWISGVQKGSVVRYGADRYFNRIEKASRRFRPRPSIA